MKIARIETLACDAGWRNYHFVKLVTEDGIVGWSEFDEGFGAPGVGTVIERLATKVVGQDAGNHERIYAELTAASFARHYAQPTACPSQPYPGVRVSGAPGGWRAILVPYRRLLRARGCARGDTRVRR